eukprot:SAG31_NODE_897_length_11148_cov_15.102815_15_plen_171_part_00
MIAQIDRTTRMLDECCRPMQLSLAGLNTARLAFVCDAVVELEAAAPELVASMLEQCSSMYTISEDGARLVSVRSGRKMWDAGEQSTGLTRVYRERDTCVFSAAACAVNLADLFTFLSQPCKLCMRNASERCRVPNLAQGHFSPLVLKFFSLCRSSLRLLDVQPKRCRRTS